MARRRCRSRSLISMPWMKSSPRKRSSSPHQETTTSAGVLKVPQILSEHFQTKKSKRRVSFDRAVVKLDSRMLKEDCAALWYSREDISSFRQDTRDAVAYRKSLGNSAWTEDYVGVYQAVAACGDYATAHILIDDCAVMGELAQATFDVSGVGLERLACPEIIKDIVQRREQLILHVGALQATTSPDRVNRLGETSRALTRTCVLYARCIAQMAAAVSDS